VSPTLTEHTVAAAARTAGLADPGLVRYVPATGSTNSDVLELAARGAPEWTVLVAGHQRTGRGRLDRTWDAPPGSSLLVSVLLRPAGAASLAPIASFAAAVAMVDALRSACGVAAGCKWPNDVIVGEQKIGGILAEGRVEGGRVRCVVVGTGVNVAQTADELPQGGSVPATSVVASGGQPDLPRLLSEYLRGLRDLYRAEDFAFRRTLLERYRGLCGTLGRTVRATTSEGASVIGTATDVGPGGELIIRTAEGTRTVTFGEVVHLRPGSPG
jgi:BirA family biotin operon repressor/biotin-[acetyl-CoA-carboxylase] ligase